MKKLTLILGILFLSACSKQAPIGEKPELNSIFVLFENGGTIPEEEQDDALNTLLHLLQQLTDLDKRKATRNSKFKSY